MGGCRRGRGYGARDYPDYRSIREVRARALLRLGRAEEAISELEGLVNISRDLTTLGWLLFAYAETGALERANALLKELEGLNASEYVTVVHTSLGNLDAAFESLGRTIDANQGDIRDLLVSP
jgi:tetratricopeptide (TPR) repeat protein